MNIHNTISMNMAREAEFAEQAAGQYIFNNGLLQNFGTGPQSISTEACLKQQEYVCKTYGLTNRGFSNAFAIAEKLQRAEDAAEVAYERAHPELNP